MSLFASDYSRLYKLQDTFLAWWLSLELPFYLTGGTALGRFYLNHRYSEDLDFFINASRDYQSYLKKFNDALAGSALFGIENQNTLFTENYARFFIHDKSNPDLVLKIEMVNDVAYYPGEPLSYRYGLIDTPVNILANKLTTIVGRDEPKDVFDIVELALNYAFRWDTIFSHAKSKTIINEIDVAERLYSFPVEWLENVNWIPIENTFERELFEKNLRLIANDFLLGKQNSLGKNQAPIEAAAARCNSKF